MRLAIISTHPIQYYAPFFREIAKSERIVLKVFYTWDKGSGTKHDPGFGKKIEWDIPLLEGYNYTFVKNTSKQPGSHHFRGIINPTLNREIEEYQPDAVLVYGWCFVSHLKAMRYFKGRIPVWFRGDSHLLDEVQGIKSLLRRVFLTWVYKNVDKAFYVGHNNKAYYKAHGLKENQLVFMPHVVDNEFFAKDHDEREIVALEWRKKLGIAANDFVVLFAGKFESKKNPELLLKTIVKLNERNENSQIFKSSNLQIHLILVGNGILEPSLKKHSEEKPYIHFLPFQNQSQMPIVYRMANVFCLPSNGPGETWGLAVNEAMACGRNVIVSDKVGCAADLVNNKTVFVFMHNNLESLTERIHHLALREIHEAHHQTILEIYSIAYNVKVLEKELK